MFMWKDLLNGLIAMFGSLLTGVSLGFASPVLDELTEKWNLNATQTYLFSNITTIVSILSPFIYFIALKYVGRKIIYFAICLASVLTYSIFLLVSQKRFWLAIFLRAIVGIELGGFSTLCPTMLIEYASPNYSALFGNMHQIGIVIGIIAMYLFCIISGWRFLCYISIGISVIGCLIIWGAPETMPRKKERSESSWTDETSLRIFSGMAIMLLQQFSGIGAIQTNLGEDIRKAGVNFIPEIANVAVMCIQLVGVFISGFIVHRVGRMPLFAGSSLGCGIILILYASVINYNNNGALPIFFISMYMLFFGIELGPLPWYIIPELMPDDHRVLGASLITSINQVGSVIVGYLFPTMKAVLGLSVGCSFFGAMCIFTAIFGFNYIVDPKSSKLDLLVWICDDEEEENDKDPFALTLTAKDF